MEILRPAFYTPIGGTHAWDETAKKVWWEDGSTFVKYLHRLNLALLRPQNQYKWSTELDGLPLIQPAKHTTWKGAAFHLIDYFENPHYSEPIYNRNLVAHSHAGQVVFYACMMGLRINSLITVGTPVRNDMERAVAHARANINYWLHIYDSKSDWTAVFGALCDGRLRVKHKFDSADRNDDIRGIGHSAILTDPAKIRMWSQEIDGKSSWASVLSYGNSPVAA